MSFKRQFEFKRFLREMFGSPQGLMSFLRAYGETPGQAAVEKWFYRGSIPGDAFASILGYLHIDRGVPFPVADYLVRGQ